MSQEELITLLYPALKHYIGYTLALHWKQTVKRWKRINPHKSNGLYTCALCDMEIAPAEFSLDHIIPQSVDSERRFDMDNLQPTHKLCNSQRAAILDWPQELIKWRSKPEGSYERKFADRVVTQYQEAYANYILRYPKSSVKKVTDAPVNNVTL